MDDSELIRWLDAAVQQGLIREWCFASEHGTLAYVIDGRTYSFEGAVTLVTDFITADKLRLPRSDG